MTFNFYRICSGPGSAETYINDKPKQILQTTKALVAHLTGFPNRHQMLLHRLEIHVMLDLPFDSLLDLLAVLDLNL